MCISDFLSILKPTNNPFIIFYIIGFLQILASIFNIKFILILHTIWKPSLFVDIKYKQLRIIVGLIGVLNILIPISFRS